MKSHNVIIEIDWAEDGDGKDICGPVGPFASSEDASAWAEQTICNGEWNTATLYPPAPRRMTAEEYLAASDAIGD